MATIRPFRAIRPNTTVQRPLEHLSCEASTGLELDYVKMRLESDGKPGSPSHLDCREFLDSLLQSGSYVQDEEPSIYVYERINDGASHLGVFALTGICDLENGNILTHEQVLGSLEQKIAEHRSEVGLEGAAILLAHEPDELLELLIQTAMYGSKRGFSYLYGYSYHKFVKVTDREQIREFQLALGLLERVYLADGHHRIGAASKAGDDWILSLYMSTRELDILPFHRLLLPVEGNGIDGKWAMERINEYFHVDPVRGNQPYRPSSKHVLGMHMGGKWFRLELRPELKLEGPIDATFLQDKVLAGVFGINDPRTDARLRCYPETDWEKLVLELRKEPSAVAFTLAAMPMEEFIRLSDEKKKLPPKSTFVAPKPVFGMLMHGIEDRMKGGRP